MKNQTEHSLATVTAGNLPTQFQDISRYLEASIADNTRQAYRKLWGYFTAWANESGLPALPASPETIAAYFSYLAESGKKPATVNSARAAIRKAHEAAGLADPTAAALTKQVMKGIRRKVGAAQIQKAAILPTDIRAMLGKIDRSAVKGQRDAALILLGFFTASRRSELVTLDMADLRETAEGLAVTIRRSKTDQEGMGMTKAVTRQDNPTFCPVRAITEYVQAAGITDGPLFREIKKGGKVQANAMTGHSIARVVKDLAKKARLDPAKYSGHSLRAGLVTAAAKEGATMAEIMAQTGHKSTDTVARYIRRARLFDDTVTRRIRL